MFFRKTPPLEDTHPTTLGITLGWLAAKTPISNSVSLGYYVEFAHKGHIYYIDLKHEKVLVDLQPDILNKGDETYLVEIGKEMLITFKEDREKRIEASRKALKKEIYDNG